ncbi:MAG TPA: hypothetical protein VIV12_18160 [Streptosporangiaceae bacterium]
MRRVLELPTGRDGRACGHRRRGARGQGATLRLPEPARHLTLWRLAVWSFLVRAGKLC